MKRFIIFLMAVSVMLGVTACSDIHITISTDEKNDEPQQQQVESNNVNQGNDYDYLISNMSENEIEAYVKNYVRPMYNDIVKNAESYSKSQSGNAVLWHDNSGIVKKELAEGEDYYNMARQYYYDSSSGDMVFAFVFKGTTEYRLYFKDNKLVRYIDATGNIFNNPTSDEAMKMAEHAVKEAY